MIDYNCKECSLDLRNQKVKLFGINGETICKNCCEEKYKTKLAKKLLQVEDEYRDYHTKAISLVEIIDATKYRYIPPQRKDIYEFLENVTNYYRKEGKLSKKQFKALREHLGDFKPNANKMYMLLKEEVKKLQNNK